MAEERSCIEIETLLLLSVRDVMALRDTRHGGGRRVDKAGRGMRPREGKGRERCKQARGEQRWQRGASARVYGSVLAWVCCIFPYLA
jgi:hypothetical protein